MIRVAFGATMMVGNLTGIGQYAYHLACGLQRREDVDLTCFYGREFSRAVSMQSQLLSGGLRVSIRKYVPAAYRVNRFFQQTHFNRGLRNRRVDVYHEPSMLALRFDGPSVITAHDLSWIRFPETHPPERVRALNAFFEPGLRCASLVLTDSEFVKSELLAVFGADPTRIVTVPLGLDPLFRPLGANETRPVLEPLGLRHGEYFLSVGTLEPRKNLQATIAAYADLPPPLRRRYPLVVAGNKGWHTSSMEHRLAPLVKSGEVRLLGYLERGDLAKVTAGALTLVYPSLYEGFGLPPLEAMGCAVPPIISTAGSLIEVVGDCGLVVEPHDIGALGVAMTRMVEDSRLRAGLATKSRERAARFTWERCVNETVAAYATALSTSSR